MKIEATTKFNQNEVCVNRLGDEIVIGLIKIDVSVVNDNETRISVSYQQKDYPYQWYSEDNLFKKQVVAGSEIKLCQSGQSYWHETGVYQKEFDELYKHLVPATGCAETIAGEMIRGVGRLYYDYFNNGNCNVSEAEYDDDGNITKVEVHPLYKRFIKLMKDVYTEIHGIEEEEKNMENAFENLREIEDIIIDCGYDEHSLSSKSESDYNHMADYCVYVVTTYPDKVNGKLLEKYPNWEIIF